MMLRMARKLLGQRVRAELWMMGLAGHDLVAMKILARIHEDQINLGLMCFLEIE